MWIADVEHSNFGNELTRMVLARKLNADFRRLPSLPPIGPSELEMRTHLLFQGQAKMARLKREHIVSNTPLFALFAINRNISQSRA
jgi:hypothetical protein